MDKVLLELIKRENWEIREEKVIVEGIEFPLVHPVAIHLKLYRVSKNPELKYQHMLAAHDYIWPKGKETWHYWTERRFREHCSGYNYISYAGGASTSKSYDAAKIALLFWLSNPRGHAVIIASTTLHSLGARIWGYVMSMINSMSIEFPYVYMRSQPPKILFERDDAQHGIFAAAAKQGDDDAAIRDLIGRHPKDGMLFIADEATDMPVALLKALPNLESGQDFFQAMFIGNSLSKFDLHGSVSTPRLGWGSVNPIKDVKWETNQKNGICLFFSCYESPAIHESDIVKKKRLGKFLITQEEIDEKEKLYGKNSDSFWRFVLGFWKSTSTDSTVVSREFIDAFRVFDRAQWLGIEPLVLVGGLDPAFSTGGDQCVLRFGMLGQTVDGDIVLDYRGESLLYRIAITARSDKSADLQVADRVLEILEQVRCPLHHVCVDANGQGRALGELIRERGRLFKPPIKIYSTRGGNIAVNSFDVVVKSYHELWFAFRSFIQGNQIKGLDLKTVNQLTTRLIVQNEKTLKQQLESKIVYKKRMGSIMPSLAHSPDEADAAALCLQSAMLNFGFVPGQRRDIPKMNGFAHEKLFMAQKLQMSEVNNGVEDRVATFTSDPSELVKHRQFTP